MKVPHENANLDVAFDERPVAPSRKYEQISALVVFSIECPVVRPQHWQPVIDQMILEKHKTENW